MRRGPGLAGLMKGQAHQNAIGAVGEQSKVVQLGQAKQQLESLRDALTEFAKKHRNRINSDPQFRQAFCEMCVAAGVDPLTSSKGLWDELLGVGKFYNELAVQILTVCLRTRDVNGGLLDLDECFALLQASRPAGQAVDTEDIERAVNCLAALGKGVTIRHCGGRRIVYSVPDEVSADPLQALEVVAASRGQVSSRELVRRLGWTQERADAALQYFVREGLCWVDTQDKTEPIVCWFPSIALAAIDRGTTPLLEEQRCFDV